MKTEELRPLVERRQRVRWWGRYEWITPRLCGEVFGDGKQLIALAPIMFRPNHFIVRIDSGWNINNHASDCELLIDNLDEIYDAIEEEFCDWPWAKKYGLKGEEARIDWNDGSAWWNEKWPELKPVEAQK